MLLKTIILAVLFLLYGAASAQVVNMGLRLESLGLHMTHSNAFNSDAKKELFYIPFPSALQLNISAFPIRNLSVDARLGGVFAWLNFSGFEYGLYSKYYLTDRYYLSGGIVMHHNGGNEGIFSGMGEEYSMPALGAGIKLTRVTNADLMLYYAGHKLLTDNYSPGILQTTFTHFDWLIKLSIDFEWEVFR